MYGNIAIVKFENGLLLPALYLTFLYTIDYKYSLKV